MRRALIASAALIATGLAAGVVYGLMQPVGQAFSLPINQQHGKTSPQYMIEPGTLAPYEDYDYAVFSKMTLPALFDLILLTKPPAGGKYNARVLYDFQDVRNYNYVEVTNRSVSLGRVENGIQMGVVSREARDPLRLGPKMVLQHRENRTAVIIGGEALVRSYGTSFAGGKLVYGAVKGGKVFDLANHRLLKADRDITFTDDFMRLNAEKDEKGANSTWEVVHGKWEVTAKRNVSLSANAFMYSGMTTGSPAVVVTGKRLWNNYAFHVSCKPIGAKPVGIYFYWRDPDNYYLFRWGGRTENGRPRREIIKMHKGKRTVLASHPGGFISGQWYRIGVAVQDDRAAITIDGHHVMSVEDTGLCYGKIGLHVESPLPAFFDDVYVTHHKHLHETFEHDLAGRWQPVSGNWSRRAVHGANSSSHDYVVNAPHDVRSVVGSWNWHDYTVQATVTDWTEGDAGLTFYYLDEDNHYLLSWNRTGKVRLSRRRNGKEKLLIAATMPVKNTPAHKLSAQIDEGLITVKLDGAEVFRQWDRDITKGKAGLYASGADRIAFDDVSVNFKPQPEPVLVINNVQSNELTMSSWADENSDWHVKPEVLAGSTVNGMWHRADFYGDTDVQMFLDWIPGEGKEVRVVLSSDAEQLNAGYSLILRRKGGLEVELRRLSNPIDKTKIAIRSRTLNIRLHRMADWLIASVNGDILISRHDPLPLHGSRVAVASSERRIDVEKVNVFSDSVIVERFNRAPSDWRVAAGTWEITNRWQCDPRWSFFSGESDGISAIWHKESFGDNVTMEYAGGIKMQKSRGSSYQYARDLNMTICGDGRDLSSGYSFIFGGWDDEYTRILRGSKVIASTSNVVIPRSSRIHRRWFYLKAEKKGGHLAFYVDDELVLEADDPEPLTGDRCAIWTQKNGIMVGRVRISGSRHSGAEPPDFKPAPICRSPY